MKKFLIVCAMMFLLISNFPQTFVQAQTSEPMIKVELKRFLGNQTEVSVQTLKDTKTSNSSITLKADTTYTLKTDGSILFLYQGNQLIKEMNTLSLQQENGNIIKINNRGYEGSFEFGIKEGKWLKVVNIMPLESYIKSVVPDEMPAEWYPDAVKSQAVAARTYAMGYIGKEINDTVQYQVYGGYDALHPKSTKAVEDTYGQVLEYNGTLINAVFSSSNGGKIESNSNAWQAEQLPYFVVKDDPYDPQFSWEVKIQKQQIDIANKDLKNYESWWNVTKEKDEQITKTMKTWLNNYGYTGKDIKIVSIPTLTFTKPTSGGRVSKGNIVVEFFVKGEVDTEGKLITKQLKLIDVNADKIRPIIGSSVMKSYLVSKQIDSTNEIIVQGKGNGHGVGLSQYGAQQMARLGKGYQEILSFYYPGTVLTKKYDKPKSGWKYENNNWYYYNNGSMKTGWLNEGGKWYYLENTGAMKTGWLNEGGKWYYLENTGAMKTGWLSEGGKWYYLENSGTMKIGWIQVGTKWYYMYTDGHMAMNTIIDGYKIGNDGAWVA
ncbi:SpoIID/LytB domain-containing protein [Bacillus sp. CGMCC 1.60114]|uniref:SpoIID/LytB domain-containing protein n=1 Tax=unclassified Bacillus (in: firmicutes) TaxID=185979 RepID=UPI0036340696